MGTYLDWSIGGLIPGWIVDVKWGFGGASSSSGSSAGRADSTVTLHCCTNTRDEIEKFKALMTPVFTNTNLLNGGTDLQVTPDGQILVITNGPYTWNGIISSVQFDEDEYATLDGEATIEFDIILELQRALAVAAQPLPNCILFSNGMDREVQFNGEGCVVGTLNFNWDGTGEVYLASVCNADPETDSIWADNVLIIKSPLGQITRQTGTFVYPFPLNGQPGDDFPVWGGKDVDITSLLTAGVNTLMIQVVDSFTLQPTIASSGNLIGWSSLYVVQVNGSANGLTLISLEPGLCGYQGIPDAAISPIGSGGGGSGSVGLPMQITAGWIGDTDTDGHSYDLGTFKFNWNGTGKIYLASNSGVINPEDDYIQFTVDATITSSIGSLTTGSNVINDFDITSICVAGQNSITITINNPSEGNLATSALWIVQIAS
jgi:hypothetical protein